MTLDWGRGVWEGCLYSVSVLWRPLAGRPLLQTLVLCFTHSSPIILILTVIVHSPGCGPCSGSVLNFKHKLGNRMVEMLSINWGTDIGRLKL